MSRYRIPRASTIESPAWPLEDMPYLRLGLAIIERAMLDAMSGHDRTALAYVRSAEFDQWCELTGVSAGRLRSKLAEHWQRRAREWAR